MADSLSLLDQALELGKRELEHLSSGNVDETEDLARERSQLLSLAWDGQDDPALEVLRDKLMQLQSLQNNLTAQAKRLHSSMRDELRRARQEKARLSGYGKAAKPAPRINSFLSKHG